MDINYGPEGIELPYVGKTYYDGQAFEDIGVVVEAIHDDLPEARVELTNEAMQRGSTFNGSTLGPREIRLECRAYKDAWQDFEDFKTALYQLIVKPSERKLQLRTHPDQYYMAHYVSFTEGDRVGGTGIGAFELTFEASDPARWGEKRAFVYTEPSKKLRQYFDIGGNTEATDMVITVKDARRSSSSGVFGMTINGSAFRVPFDRFSSAVTLVISPKARVVADEHAMTTTGSVWRFGTTWDTTWPTADPGRWYVKVTEGSCSNVSFAWTQRYL